MNNLKKKNNFIHLQKINMQFVHIEFDLDDVLADP